MRRLKRRINDGARTGLKQDRYRNSRFEVEEPEWKNTRAPGGVTRKTLNTLGGPFDENRGRRNASDRSSRREDNPFENGKLRNWNHREGWDRFFDGRRERFGRR